MMTKTRIVKALYFSTILVACFMTPMSNAAGSGPCKGVPPCLKDCDPDWICTDDDPQVQQAKQAKQTKQLPPQAQAKSQEPQVTCESIDGTCIANCGGNPCDAAGGGGAICPPKTICCQGKGCKASTINRYLRFWN